MNRICVALILLVPALSQKTNNSFLGRWDIVVTSTNGAKSPSWMEVTEKDGQLAARVQPRAGSVRPVPGVKLENSHLIVTLWPGDDNRPPMVWDLAAAGNDKFSGTQKRGETAAGTLAGVRAPALKREAPKAWSDPEPLFNGKDLTGWEPDRPTRNNWVAQDGALLNQKAGANLRSTRTFNDFKLHIEYNCPEGGNSGIYLRGRYEIQVEYEPAGTEDKYHQMGAIYGMVPVEADVPRKPGEWETFEVTFIGRNVTVVRNGVTIIKNREIAGITGGAIDSNEAEPGPFYFQGDHTGGMKYRNITVSVPKK